MQEPLAPAARRAPTFELALDHAETHLARLGYRILARRFHGADLIAGNWPRILVCRVETIGPPPGVSPAGRAPLRRAASAFLARACNRGFREVRCDRLVVCLDPAGRLVGIEHHPHAL